MDDDGFGGFDAPDQDASFGGFDETPAPTLQVEETKPSRKASSRAGVYAKSPMQRRVEEAAAMEYQDMLEKEQRKQSDMLDGFGTEPDNPHQEEKSQNKPNMWWQAGNNVYIPPFVPRDERNAKTWDVGKIKKSLSDKTVIGGSHGDFLIRETMKGDRHVVCVNDHGNLFEMYIRHQPSGPAFMFMSREFDTLEGIVKHLQRNALYNKQGLPLYIDKPLSL